MGSSEEGEDDSGKKKHTGTSQKAQKGPDFSKLLVLIYWPLYIQMYTVPCPCIHVVILYVWAGWGRLCAVRVCESGEEHTAVTSIGYGS